MYLKRFLVLFLVVTSAMTIVMVSSNARAQETSYYQIIVQGGGDANKDRAKRLKTFYERLLAELHVKDLGDADIGCDKCAELAAADLEELDQFDQFQPFLTFQMEREGMRLPAFVVSYHFVQTSHDTIDHDLFSLTLDGQVTSSADCPTSPPPPGCAPRPICIQTSRCDKPYGGSCQVCPTPP